MRRIPAKKTVALASAALVLAGGGAAIAEARDGRPSPSSFLDAVAKHLGVSRAELDEATKAAAFEQVDAAREAGRITEEQAEALKARIEAGEVPPFFGPVFGGFHGGLHHHVGADLSAAAEYLGLSEAELRERLVRGRSLADVAEAQGKSVDGLKEALVDEAEKRLDEAVDEGMLTEEQARAMLDGLRSRIDAVVEGELPRWREHRGGLRDFPGAFPHLRGMGPPERAA